MPPITERKFLLWKLHHIPAWSFYHETDPMDIVNHSNYIHMAEEARVDFMEKIGIGYSRMEEQGHYAAGSGRYL